MCITLPRNFPSQITEILGYKVVEKTRGGLYRSVFALPHAYDNTMDMHTGVAVIAKDSIHGFHAYLSLQDTLEALHNISKGSWNTYVNESDMLRIVLVQLTGDLQYESAPYPHDDIGKSQIRGFRMTILGPCPIPKDMRVR